MTALRSLLLTTSLALGGSLLAATGLITMRANVPSVPAAVRDAQEAQYLPSGESLGFITFGYRNALSDILWINTVSYFGKHFGTDKNYRWLNHMCTLVTDLNPRVYDPYYFCSTMLGWESKAPEEAVKMLSKATEAHPDDWFFFYLRGFYRLFLIKDPAGAVEDFSAAARRPNAHPIAARLAAKKIADIDTPDTAIRFLTDMVARSKDPHQREAFEARILELRYERDLQAIEAAQRIFTEKNARSAVSIQELLDAQLLGGDLRDPFGGTYQIDPTTGAASSTSGRKRVSLYGVRQK